MMSILTINILQYILEREAGYFKSVGAYSLYAFMNVANNLKLSITGQTLTLNISVHYQHNINFKVVM